MPGAGAISVAGVADLDGDGRGDILAGDGEHAYAFSGATGTLLYTFSSINPDPNYTFGSSVAGVGDFDGDSYDDLAVGSREFGLSQPGELNGAVYLFSGADGTLLQAIFVEDFPHTQFGESLSALRYVDSQVGFAAGAPGYWGCEGEDSERVFLFKPGAFMEVIENPHPCNGEFGASVAGVLDLDGDGGGDVAVGAPTFNPDYPSVAAA